MLRSLYVLLDYHLAATDGLQGAIRDFLFDDETWTVHYIVAETPTPLGRRQVLVRPSVAGRADWESKQLPVALTREEIRTSPPIESDMPIYLQHKSGLLKPASHLRSMREVSGYSLIATDGEIGILEDFIIEDTLWGVHFAVAALTRPSGRSVLLPSKAIASISWSSKTALVALARSEASVLPEFDPASPGNHDTAALFDYYGRRVFSLPSPAAVTKGEVHTR